MWSLSCYSYCNQQLFLTFFHTNLFTFIFIPVSLPSFSPFSLLSSLYLTLPSSLPPPLPTSPPFPLHPLLRNPNHQERISFNYISDYLRQSDETLTYWSQEDKSVSPKAHVLGAALHSSERLYLDLQHRYKQQVESYIHDNVSFSKYYNPLDIIRPLCNPSFLRESSSYIKIMFDVTIVGVVHAWYGLASYPNPVCDLGMRLEYMAQSSQVLLLQVI